MAHAGVGSVSFTTCLLLNDILKVKPTSIPVQGTGPSMNALIGSQIDYMCDQIVNAVQRYSGQGSARRAGLDDAGQKRDRQVDTGHQGGRPLELKPHGTC
jgi:putative tricarboxylic transport membrane protein